MAASGGAYDAKGLNLTADSYDRNALTWSISPGGGNHATVNNDGLVSFGSVGASYTVTASSTGVAGCSGGMLLNVVKVEMKLERVGDTVVDPSNDYSENTTVRVTAVNAKDPYDPPSDPGVKDALELDAEGFAATHKNSVP